jgi:hypothetical protein
MLLPDAKTEKGFKIIVVEISRRRPVERRSVEQTPKIKPK